MIILIIFFGILKAYYAWPFNLKNYLKWVRRLLFRMSYLLSNHNTMLWFHHWSKSGEKSFFVQLSPQNSLWLLVQVVLCTTYCRPPILPVVLKIVERVRKQERGVHQDGNSRGPHWNMGINTCDRIIFECCIFL